MILFPSYKDIRLLIFFSCLISLFFFVPFLYFVLIPEGRGGLPYLPHFISSSFLIYLLFLQQLKKKRETKGRHLMERNLSKKTLFHSLTFTHAAASDEASVLT